MVRSPVGSLAGAFRQRQRCLNSRGMANSGVAVRSERCPSPSPSPT
jgi:hypothetical protein